MSEQPKLIRKLSESASKEFLSTPLRATTYLIAIIGALVGAFWAAASLGFGVWFYCLASIPIVWYTYVFYKHEKTAANFPFCVIHCCLGLFVALIWLLIVHSGFQAAMAVDYLCRANPSLTKPRMSWFWPQAIPLIVSAVSTLYQFVVVIKMQRRAVQDLKTLEQELQLLEREKKELEELREIGEEHKQTAIEQMRILEEQKVLLCQLREKAEALPNESA